MQNQGCLWAQPDINGPLCIRGRGLRPWNSKFFALKGSYLFCFKDDKQSKCEEVIPLEGAQVEARGLGPEDLLLIVITIGPIYTALTKQPFYSLAAETIQSQAAWLTLLLHATLPRTQLLVALHEAGKLQDLTDELAEPVGRMSIAKAMRLSLAQAPYSATTVETLAAASTETKRRASVLATAVRKSNFGQTLRKTLSEATGLRSVAFEEDLETRPDNEHQGVSYGKFPGSPRISCPPDTSSLTHPSLPDPPRKASVNPHPPTTSLGFSSAPVVEASEVRLLHKPRPSVKFHEAHLSGDTHDPPGTVSDIPAASLPRGSRAGLNTLNGAVEANLPSFEKQLAQKRASLRPAMTQLVEEASSDEKGEDVLVTGLARQLRTEITKRQSIKSAQRDPSPPHPPPPGPPTRAAPPPPPPPPPGKQSAKRSPLTQPASLVLSHSTATRSPGPSAAPAERPTPRPPPPPPPPPPPRYPVSPSSHLHAAVATPSGVQSDECVLMRSPTPALSQRSSVGVPGALLQEDPLKPLAYNNLVEGHFSTADACEPIDSSPGPGTLFTPPLSELSRPALLAATSAQVPPTTLPRPGLENPAALRKLLRKVEPSTSTDKITKSELAQPAMFKLRPAASRAIDTNTPSRPGFERPALRSTPSARASTYGAQSVTPQEGIPYGGAIAHAEAGATVRATPWGTPADRAPTSTAPLQLRQAPECLPGCPAPSAKPESGILGTSHAVGGDHQNGGEPYTTQGSIAFGEQVVGGSPVADGDTLVGTTSLVGTEQPAGPNPLSASQAIMQTPLDLGSLWHMSSLPAQPMAGWGPMVPPRLSMLSMPGWPVGAGPGVMPGEPVSLPSLGQYPYTTNPSIPNLAAGGMMPMVVMGPRGPMLVMAPATEVHMPSVENSPTGPQRMKWQPAPGTLAPRFDSELRSRLMNRAPPVDSGD